MKRKGLISACLVLVLTLALPLIGGCKSKMEYRIGVTQFATHPAADAAREAFIQAMADEGFVEGVNVHYDFRNPEGDPSAMATIAQKFASEKVDLIYSFGTSITQACISATEGMDIPIVFGGVTDPVDAALIPSWEETTPTVTGVSDWCEVRDQIQLILDICPDVKRLGTVYNAGEPNSVVQIEELEKSAPGLGIDEVVKASVATSADVRTATLSLVVKVDAIWIPTDNTVVSAFEAVVGACEENQIPLFGSEESQTERGAIGSRGVSYTFVGRECGRIAARILGGESPASISCLRCELDYVVNPAAAERVGITVPQSVVDRATRVIE